jgi:hypothetical protein
MSSDPIRKLKAQAAQEARQRETKQHRQELLVQVEREYDGLRFYGERTGTDNKGSNRGWAEQIVRFLTAVRAVGWGDRFEALQPNDNAAWTFSLDIYRHCWVGEIDGATAKLDEAEAIGQSWARAGITDALKRTIPDAIVSPPSLPGNAGEAAHVEGVTGLRDQGGEGQREGDGEVDSDVPAADYETSGNEFTGRQRSILVAMSEHEIASERRRKYRGAIVKLINRTHNAQSYGRDFAALVKRGLLKSREGPRGGVWLTLQGKAEAQRLRSSN